MGLFATSAHGKGVPRFDHAVHLEKARAAGQVLTCAQCHTGGVAASAERPGQRDHAGCDGADCHATDFYGKPGEGDAARRPVCLVCHQDDRPWADLRTLNPFPTGGRFDPAYCVRFSHKAHLTAERAGTDEAACLKCHHVDGEGRTYSPPTHADCAGCHEEGSPIPMSACEACHVQDQHPDGSPLVCRPWLPKDKHRVTEKFQHDTHRADVRSGEALSCGHCHTQVAGAESVQTIVLLNGRATMNGSCKSCHNGRTPIPGTKRRVFSTDGKCTKCHRGNFMQFQAPEGH